MSVERENSPIEVTPQQPVHWTDSNITGYKMANNISCTASDETLRQQQIIYYTVPLGPYTNEGQQTNFGMQQQSNILTANQYASAEGLSHPHYYQQQRSNGNIHIRTDMQDPSLHANTSRYQTFIPAGQQIPNIMNLPQAGINIPAISSTPISNSAKRGRNDVSGISDSNVQVRQQFHNTYHTANANNIPFKRLRGMNQWNVQTDYDPLEPSEDACRFASTRYPFSPFSIVFTQDVRDKIVVDDLSKYIRETFNMELKLIAYRRARTVNNECRILIFVENIESFLILFDQKNWPATLASCNFTTKKPSIPPQLSLVIPSVSLQTNWEDFVQDLKDIHPSISNVIRLKNKAQQPVRAVKLEFSSANTREAILEEGEISILHMKYKVVEFFSQANVLICSNCFGIGHFRKNCPQKNESTCKTCSEKFTNPNDHVCSGMLKCKHCGGEHTSNNTKCKVVQEYRINLTRNLLSKRISGNTEPNKPSYMINNIPHSYPISTANGLTYANVVKGGSAAIPNELLLKKLDSILTKVEDESSATRHAIEEIKQEMRNRNEETKQHVEALEEKIKISEKKFVDFSSKIGEIIQNICSSLLAPKSSQGQQWKVYWQEQIKALEEARSLFSKQIQ